MSSLASETQSSISALHQTWHEFQSLILYLTTACTELNGLPQCQMFFFLALVLLGSLKHAKKEKYLFRGKKCAGTSTPCALNL